MSIYNNINTNIISGANDFISFTGEKGLFHQLMFKVMSRNISQTDPASYSNIDFSRLSENDRKNIN